jgi:transcriptional antiterminator RfaH
MGGKTQAMREALEQPAATGPRWFAVQCHANHEREARQNLINAHVGGRFGCPVFEVYLPMRLCPHPKARHPITPFFPRYLFVRFDPGITQWLEIISTVGVHDIIRKQTPDGRVPRAVPDGMIERIRSWEIDGVIHLLATPKKAEPVFKPGDKVTVVEGLFAGYEGLVSIANDNDRVMIMLGLVDQGKSPQKVWLQSGALQGAALRTPSKG